MVIKLSNRTIHNGLSLPLRDFRKFENDGPVDFC